MCVAEATKKFQWACYGMPYTYDTYIDKEHTHTTAPLHFECQPQSMFEKCTNGAKRIDAFNLLSRNFQFTDFCEIFVDFSSEIISIIKTTHKIHRKHL